MGALREEDPTPEDHDVGEKKKHDLLFSELSRLFNDIAEVVTEQAKAQEGSKNRLSLKDTHEIARYKRKEELLKNAETIANNLELFKEELAKDFGIASYAFVAKFIDPMIEHALELIKELSSKSVAHSKLPKLYEQAVQSVELYSQFRDEKKLKRKIILDAIQSTKQAIEKDCEILAHYEHHAFQEMKLDVAESAKFTTILEEKLKPIFLEFQLLKESEIDTFDLKEFFIWKSNIDEKRAALTELGFLTIDSIFTAKSSSKALSEFDDDEFSEDDWRVLSVIEKNIINTSAQLASLTTLEEKAIKLFEILEDEAVFQAETFLEIEELLAEIKERARDFEKMSVEHK